MATWVGRRAEQEIGENYPPAEITARCRRLLGGRPRLLPCQFGSRGEAASGGTAGGHVRNWCILKVRFYDQFLGSRHEKRNAGW